MPACEKPPAMRVDDFYPLTQFFLVLIFLRFENFDFLTESYALPYIPAEMGDVPTMTGTPVGGFCFDILIGFFRGSFQRHLLQLTDRNKQKETAPEGQLEIVCT